MSSSPQHTFVFRTPYSRRFADPNFHAEGVERHIWFVPVRDVPRGLPRDANARDPNIRKQVYREVESSLLNNEGVPGSFHLKHKGITLVAERVKKLAKDRYEVTMLPGQGILDGGHTYELLTKDRDEPLPESQYVKFEVLVGVPADWIAELSAGLNTSVQVQPMSIDNLQGLFDWIQEELEDQPYFSELAWKENESGSFSAKDLIGILTLFNIHYFPNGTDAHPVEGYKFKASALKRYENDEKGEIYSYRKLRPILRDILELHDVIRAEARRIYNQETTGRGGNLVFVEDRHGDKHWEFPFTGEQDTYRLMNGALYPMLAAFRWMVEPDPDTNNYRWRGGFNNVKSLFRSLAAEMMRMTHQVSNEQGRNVDAIGKSRSHWAALHSRVAMADLMSRIGAPSGVVASV